MSQRPSITNLVLERLKDNAAEDTVEMARQVKATMESPGWDFVQDFLTQMVSGLDVAVERGIHEQAEYAAMIAERRALRTSQTVAEAIVEAGNRADRALLELASRLEAGEPT